MLYTINYQLSPLVSLILNEPDLTHYTAQKLNEKMKKHKKFKECGTFAWLHKKIPAVTHTFVYNDS